jgi:hypothetical protein
MPTEPQPSARPESVSAGPPVTVILQGNAPEPTKRRTDWVSLASSAPAVLGFLGLIVYAVVRVGHDAFYARFGVTAEEVGLSQTTILGRAALYFVFFLTAAIALLGVSAVIARPATAIGTRRRSDGEGGLEDKSGRFWARVGVGFLTLAACSGFAGVIVAGIEGAWPLALTIGVLIPLALVASPLSRGHRAAAAVLFGVLAAWSALVAFLVASRGQESSPGAASLSAPSRWLIFGFCVLAVAMASVALLRQFETSSNEGQRGGTESERRQMYLTTLSLLALLPLAVAFFAPRVGRFVTEASDRTAAAVAMWAILFGFVVLGFQAFRGGRRDERGRIVDILLIVSLASVFAGTALYLASLRGLDLANQALAGNRITQSGFGMFSVRADIVCLEPVSEPAETATRLPRAPVIYLGQSANNVLVLFDLERREKLRAREEIEGRDIGAPQRVPLRIPAANVMVRVANLIDPNTKYIVPVTLKNQHFDGKWQCIG